MYINQLIGQCILSVCAYIAWREWTEGNVVGSVINMITIFVIVTVYFFSYLAEMYKKIQEAKFKELLDLLDVEL